VAATLYVLFFTTVFSNPMGLVDSVRAYLPWAEKGVEGGTGHEKPWTYFPELLQAFEATTVLCALGGGVLAFRRRESADPIDQIDPIGEKTRFGRFCAVWAASQVVAYSLIPYKTPWLMINMVVPAALTAAVLFREVAARPLSIAARAALTAVLAAGLGWSAWRAADLSFRRYDDPSLGLVYSDTNRQVWDLLAFVRAAARRAPHPADVSLAAFFSGRWPLPWYLRDFTHSQWDRQVEKLPTEDIILADPQQEASLQPLVARGYRRRQFLLRQGVFVAVWVRPGLWPAGAVETVAPHSGT
jgi:predicted membrane-bound mannosyltransferase